MCAADCERYHLLQLRDSVTTIYEVRGEPEYESSRTDHEVLAGGVASCPSEWALYLPGQRTDYRPGCDHGRARFRLTEFSGVWAYNPNMELKSHLVFDEIFYCRHMRLKR